MNFTFDSLHLFEQISDSPNMEYVTTAEKIHKYILTITEHYSDEYARSRLNNFKNCLYYASFEHNNPMYHTIVQDKLNLPSELIYVYELMYQFLCSSKHEYIKFDRTDCNSYGYNNADFSYHVPLIFMPIFSAYISASLFSKSESITVTSFFKKITAYLNNINSETLNTYFHIICKEDYIKFSNMWLIEYLGKNYFCTIDDLYNTYSKKDSHKTMLENSVKGLTFLFLENTERPNPASRHIVSLLKDYVNSVERASLSKSQNSTGNSLLYDYTEPLQLEKELQYMEALFTNLSNTLNKMLDWIDSFINYHHKKYSKYSLYINNFNLFTKTYNDFVKQIQEQMDNINYDIYCYFQCLAEDSLLISLQESKQLYLDKFNEETHIDKYVRMFSSCYKCILKDLGYFFRQVEHSCSATPEKYNSLIINRNYFSDFKSSILKSLDKLNENIKTNFSKLPAILYQKKIGKIQELKYSTDIFSKNEIIRITLILSGKYLSEDYVSRYLNQKGFTFPLSRNQLLFFLINYNKIFSDL